IAPGSRSSHPLCGYEKCVYVLIVLVDAGGSVDAGDAGPPGVSSFGVSTVARRSVGSVAAVSLRTELGWVGVLRLRCRPSPRNKNSTDWMARSLSASPGMLTQASGRPTGTGAIKGPELSPAE